MLNSVARRGYVDPMARQAGLGKSLHEVLESLKPAESWPDAPRLALAQLEQELDQLTEEVQALHERVEGLTADAARAALKRKKAKKQHKKQREKGKR
jgi:chromosome segregation ATPase